MKIINFHLKLLIMTLMLIQVSLEGCKPEKPVEKAGPMLKDMIKTANNEITILPISHASMILKIKDKTIFIDPVGDKALYSAYPNPDLIIFTDNHGDHLNVDLVKEIKGAKTIILGPKAVEEKLKGIKIIGNGEKTTLAGMTITAMPMYNTTKERLKYHSKGRGNGYLFEIDDKRIYHSGDTEDIPEMRSLKNIDAAFICMNLPYTMTEEQAASAVLEFKPKIVYPFHYRGAENKFSDLEKFKKLVSVNKEIDVRLLKWY